LDAITTITPENVDFFIQKPMIFFQDYTNSKTLVHEPGTMVSKTGYKRDMCVLGIHSQENCTSRKAAALFMILEAVKQLGVSK